MSIQSGWIVCWMTLVGESLPKRADEKCSTGSAVEGSQNGKVRTTLGPSTMLSPHFARQDEHSARVPRVTR
jgi:hypothetical protein